MSKLKLTCPRCGKSDCSRQHEGGSTSSFILCHNCGYKGNEDSWKKQQNPFLEAAHAYAGGGVAEKNQAADKPEPQNNPDYLATREKGKRLRRDPKKRLQERQFGPGECETVRAKSKTMDKKAQEIERQEPIMPFKDDDESEFQRAKKEIGDAWISGDVFVQLKDNPKLGTGTVVQITSDPERPIKVQWAYDKEGFPDQYGINSGDFGIRKHSPLELQMDKRYVMMGSSAKKFKKGAFKMLNLNPFINIVAKQNELGSINPFIEKVEHKERKEKKLKGSDVLNPFTKKARDFKWTDEQIKRKKDKNMVFTEGPQNLEEVKDSDGKSKSKKEKDDPGKVIDPELYHKKFDTVDRKEYRRSPDPKQLIPGYKEWYDANVDEYYPGWVDDHVKNSGGSVPGSNTEKMMNLDDGEKHHAPVYPTEAVYEKLLESRHNFDDDYVRIVADNKEHIFTKKAADQILDLKKQENLNKKPNLQRIIT